MCRGRARLSVLLADAVAVAVSVGPVQSRLVFEGQAVRLADVHPVLLRLQVLVVALVVLVVVLSLAVVGGRVAGQSRRRWHGGRSWVTEARGLAAKKQTDFRLYRCVKVKDLKG